LPNFVRSAPECGGVVRQLKTAIDRGLELIQFNRRQRFFAPAVESANHPRRKQFNGPEPGSIA
jgi:hypothetical protein